MSVLAIENLSVSYDGISTVLSNVSLTVNASEILCIVGESGSGKSTLLNTVLKLLPDNAHVTGHVSFLDEDILSLTEKEMLKKRGSQIAVVFQDTLRHLNPIQKVKRQYRRYLKTHLKLKDVDYNRIEKNMLQQVKLDDVNRVLNAYPFELSGGMRQRVGIAMAMSLKPTLLLADEPTSALDVTIQAQVVQMLLDFRKQYGTTMIIVTHNIGLAYHVADKIAVMKQGEVVEIGLAKEVITNPKHDYTKTLVESVIDLKDEQLI